MNINTISYWISEGLSSIWKNKKIVFTSLGTIIATMIIIGFFFVFSENANVWIEQAKEEQGRVVVYLDGELKEELMPSVGDLLLKIEGVKEVEFTSKKEAFEKAESMEGINTDGLEEGFFPAYYTLTINNYERINNIIAEARETEGVGKEQKDVRISENADKVVKLAKTLKALSITVLILLTVAATFIMMNSVKLIMYARRKEISIMKYVGATDNFIKTPFIIEGVIISLIGVIITIVIINLLYSGIINSVGSITFMNALLTLDKVMPSLTFILLTIGVGIGVVGSSISIKRYLDV